MRTSALLVSSAVVLVATGARAQRGAPPRERVQAPAAPPPPIELTETDSSGLTAEEVGKRAAATSFNVNALDASVRAAAARVDEAWVSFLPRINTVARYTYLNNFTPLPFVLPVPNGLNEVFTTAAPKTAIASTAQLISTPAPQLTFAPVQDNYLLQANVIVPISDYFLRINQAYSAASASHEAAEFDAAAGRAKAAADGKIAFYTWLRARGAAVVAIQALYDQKTHLADATNQFAVGGASKADIMVAETSVAQAELQVERAKNFAALSEKQVRLAVHVKDSEHIVPAEELETTLPPMVGNLPRLTDEALSTRYEIKSIDANESAVRHRASLARASILPSLSGFGDAVYGNPNPREVPQITGQWVPTWDVGAQFTWSPTDAIGAGFSGSAYSAQADALDAQKGAVRDGIRLEVMQAYQAVREGDVALEVTKRELVSAGEAYRVARDLFMVGRAAGTMLTDAQTELTRARLDALNAKADARIARVRLDHALGRDTHRH